MVLSIISVLILDTQSDRVVLLFFITYPLIHAVNRTHRVRILF